MAPTSPRSRANATRLSRSRRYAATVCRDARFSAWRWRQNAATASSGVTPHRYRAPRPVANYLAAPRVQISLSNPIAKIRQLWQLAKNERATPREIGWAVAVGVFVG